MSPRFLCTESTANENLRHRSQHIHCTAWEGGVLFNHFHLYQSWHARVSFIKMQTVCILMPMCICAMQLVGRCRLLFLTNTGGANNRIQI